MKDNFLGFIISVVVGILFIVIFPIVGCCFCCCRLSCEACCAQPKEEDPNVSCKKAVYGTILFVIVAFTAYVIKLGSVIKFKINLCRFKKIYIYKVLQPTLRALVDFDVDGMALFTEYQHIDTVSIFA